MLTKQCIRAMVQHLAGSRYMSTAPAGAQSCGRKMRPISKMCGWQIHSYGSLEEVEYSDHLKMPMLTSPNQLLVKVTASSVNPIDVAMISIILRSVRSYLRVSDRSYNPNLKPHNPYRCVQRGMCTTSISQTRESFNEFRAREEQKEKEALHQNASSNNHRKQTDEDDSKVLAIKESILNAALGFVITHGWSKQAIAKGAESVNYPSVANGLFPQGGIELVQFFYRQCNEKLVEHLRQETSGGAEKMVDPVSFSRKALEVRLRMLIPYLKHWPQALGLMTLPPNVPKSLANVLTLVDDICYYAGDRSVDFNWYTRRVGLASIYKATELYMLQDSSSDFEKTWKFLERRIEEASILHDFLVKSEGATSHLQNAVGSAFSTARNILGLNFARR